MKETPAHCPLHLQFNFIDYNVLSYKTMGEAVLSRAVDLSGHRRPSKGYKNKQTKNPPTTYNSQCAHRHNRYCINGIQKEVRASKKCTVGPG